MDLWTHLRAGGMAAVVGTGMPMVPTGWRVVRVRCDDGRPLGPWLAARDRLAHLMGRGETRLLDAVTDRLRAGLRQRLAGDPPELQAAAALANVAALAPRFPGTLLVFEGVDRAEPETLALLRRAAERPGLLGFPVLLVYDAAPAGAAAELLRMVARPAEGPAAPAAPGASPPDAAAPGAAAPGAAAPGAAAPEAAAPVAPVAAPDDDADRPEPWSPETVPAAAGAPVAPPAEPVHPPDVLLVLRAAAVDEDGFTVERVADRLGVSALAVLAALQRAADGGEPIADGDDGTLRLAPARAAALRSGTLPSLRRAWAAPAGAAPPPPAVVDPYGVEPVEDDMPAPIPFEAARARRRGEEPPLPNLANWARLYAAARSADEHADDAAEEPDLDDVSPDTPPPGPPLRFGFGRDLAREPDHPPEPSTLEALVDAEPAAGPPAAEPPPARPSTLDALSPEPETAGLDAGERALETLARARSLEHAGDVGRAVEEVREAIMALDQLAEPTDDHRRLAAALHAELGRLLWRSMGPGAAFTLEGALEALDHAEARLGDADPAPLRALVWSLQAGVLLDRGDPPSLETALRRLDAAMRVLQAAGEPRAAARLLNDQAAVWVRIGDPVRAAHLLRESRAVFAAATDPEARVELAETDLCLARLPLNAAIRPGQEAEAWRRALGHARDAVRVWHELGMDWEEARARETEGRLLARAGDVEGAARVLADVARAQADLGDALGLARTTAALAEVLAAVGRARDALNLLRQSVALNAEKGSAIGIAWNRRAFDRLWSGLDPARRRAAFGAARPVAVALETAEGRLGRLALPEDDR